MALPASRPFPLPDVCRATPLRRMATRLRRIICPDADTCLTNVTEFACGSLADIRRAWMSALPRWPQPVDATLYLEVEMECALMGHRNNWGDPKPRKRTGLGHDCSAHIAEICSAVTNVARLETGPGLMPGPFV